MSNVTDLEEDIHGILRRHDFPTVPLTSPEAAQSTELIRKQIGLLNPMQSLRGDPFESLPVRGLPYIPEVVDFFFHVFGSPYVYRPELIRVKEPEQFQRRDFQFALQHEVLFHSITTLTLACLQMMKLPQTLLPSKEVLLHHTKALSMLQQELSRPDNFIDDSVLLSILTLLGIDVRSLSLNRFKRG